MRISKNEKAVSPVIGVILMVVITVIIAAVLAVFAFGMGSPTKAPEAQLKFTALHDNSSGTDTLKIEHTGGDPLVLKDEQITVRFANDGADAIDPNPTTMDAPAGDGSGWALAPTLTAGNSVTGPLTGTTGGEILQITIMDIPSGQQIANTKVAVQSI